MLMLHIRRFIYSSVICFNTCIILAYSISQQSYYAWKKMEFSKVEYYLSVYNVHINLFIKVKHVLRIWMPCLYRAHWHFLINCTQIYMA